MNVLASKGQLRASFFRWALFCVPACLLLGFLSVVVGGGLDSLWFESLAKPDLLLDLKWYQIVPAVLYVLMGIALALVCAAWGARGRTSALVTFSVQLFLNLAWPPIFFGMHQITAALVVMGLLSTAIILTIALFWKVRKLAAVLMLPYLIWVCYATLLNYDFLQLNPEFDGKEPTRAVQRVEF